jgi:hypothetical protein
VSEDWRARPNDHLVEPLFGGLGHEAPQDPVRGARRGLSTTRALLVAVVVAIVGLGIAALALAG